MGYSRHYRKKDYESDVLGSFITGLIFLSFGILSLVFKQYNIDFIGLSSWGIWLFIPAFFIMLGSVSQLRTNKRLKKDAVLVLNQRGAGRYTLDEIAADIGVRRRHLLALLVDLRSEGKISYKYDDQTGEIILGEMIVYEQAPDYQPLPKRSPPEEKVELQKEKNYCIFCGQRLEPGMQFCPNCGSQLG